MLAKLCPSYWLVLGADASTGDAHLSESMREELNIQVSHGLSRAELRDQFAILPWIYLLLMIPSALAGWGINSVDALSSLPRPLALMPLTFCGIAAVWYGIRWMTTAEDDKVVRWRVWVEDGAILLASAVAVLLLPAG